MLRLDRNAQTPEFFIQIPHEFGNPFSNDPVVMIIQLLPFCRHTPEERSAGIDDIFSLQILLPVNQKVLLLRSDRRTHKTALLISEKAQNTKSFSIDGLHRAKEGRLLIQSFPGIRAKSGRDAERHGLSFSSKKSRAGTIPDGIPSRFKSCPKTARRKGRSIRFGTHQFFSGKLQHDLSFSYWT